jgi:hypothetical protein
MEAITDELRAQFEKAVIERCQQLSRAEFKRVYLQSKHTDPETFTAKKKGYNAKFYEKNKELLKLKRLAKSKHEEYLGDL